MTLPHNEEVNQILCNLLSNIQNLMCTLQHTSTKTKLIQGSNSTWLIATVENSSSSGFAIDIQSIKVSVIGTKRTIKAEGSPLSLLHSWLQQALCNTVPFARQPLFPAWVPIFTCSKDIIINSNPFTPHKYPIWCGKLHGHSTYIYNILDNNSVHCLEENLVEIL